MESYLGFFAAFCTTVAFIPQVVKVYKSKHTKDISLGMFLLSEFGIHTLDMVWIDDKVLPGCNCKCSNNNFSKLHTYHKNKVGYLIL